MCTFSLGFARTTAVLQMKLHMSGSRFFPSIDARPKALLQHTLCLQRDCWLWHLKSYLQYLAPNFKLRLQMMASLTWDDSQRRWTQQAPGSCLEALAARRKARPLLTGLAGGLLHSSPSEMDSLLPDLQPKPETVAHHQTNLQQTQVQASALEHVPLLSGNHA